MHVTDIIESKVWRHLPTARTASAYGSTPWISEAERRDWHMEHKGWTWRMSDNTIGMCRQSVETKTQAAVIAHYYNLREIESLKSHAKLYPGQADAYALLIGAIPLFGTE